MKGSRPEQAALSGVDVDTRCDVYALGVIFYFLTRATLEPFVTPAFTALVAW